MAILSIQSHVAYGYVGNTAATFPLQRLGKEVWAINTVEFSNHTGYGAWKGRVLDTDLTSCLVEGIADRGVLGQCEAVLSGYLGDAAAGAAIIQAVRRVKASSPRALYCCDPVIGDMGLGIYVTPGIPEILKQEVIPLADIVTPNQFELELLTGLSTGKIAEARKAIDRLHALGPRVCLVTSYQEEGVPEPHIDMLASNGAELFRIRTPELPFGATMSGSGDVTAALFLFRYLETGDIRRALEVTAGSIYGVMKATFDAKSRELLLVQAQDELVAPSMTFNAVKL